MNHRAGKHGDQQSRNDFGKEFRLESVAENDFFEITNRLRVETIFKFFKFKRERYFII